MTERAKCGLCGQPMPPGEEMFQYHGYSGPCPEPCDKAKRCSNNTTLDDESTMPFGKHKGQRLGDVPDSYWRWFLGQDWCDSWPDLVRYANHVIDD